MEQQDSLKAELQNLSRIQMEQVNILKNMAESDATERSLNEARKTQQDVPFNTPNMYAASAAPHGANPFPTPQYISPYAQSMNQKFVNSAQALGSNGGQYGFMGTVSPSSQASLQTRTLMGMDYGSRASQAAVTGVGAAAATATSFGLGAVLPGLAGIGASMAGGVAIGAYVDAGVEEMKKNSALKKYIYKNSNMFINQSESNNDRGISGFSRDESTEAAQFVRTMNDEFYINDDEMMNLLQKYTEGGLLKDSKDLKSFKERMTSLTKTVKEGALILNETYESIADLLAEMKKAGIDQNNYNDLMGMGNILGSLSGQDGSDVVRTLLDFIKNLNFGTSADSDFSMSRLEDVSIYMTDYFNKLEEMDKKDMTYEEKSNYNMIKNLGGSIEASKHVMATMEKMTEREEIINPSSYFFDWNKDEQDWKFNAKNFQSFLDSNMSLEDMYARASEKFNQLEKEGQGVAINKWKSQGHMYMKNSMQDGQITDTIGRVLEAYIENPSLKAQGFDAAGILDKYFGVTDSGTQNLLSGFLTHKGANPGLAGQIKLQNLWQQQTAGTLAQAPSLSEMTGSLFEKAKDWGTQVMVDFDNWAGKKVQGLMDKFSGADKIPVRYDKTFTTRTDMNSVSLDEVATHTRKTNDLLAAGFETLKALGEKGYTLNGDLMNFLGDKFDSSKRTVEYDREVITDWEKVSEGLKESKDEIISEAEKNSLSEVIVAALLQYNNSRPNNEKINISETAKTLGEKVFEYGGNQQLGLAATFGNQAEIDAKLKSLGYDMDRLRATGTQEVVANVNLGSLELDEKITNQVNSILGQNVGVGSPEITGQVIPTAEDIVHQDLRTKSNVTADDLNKIIDKNVGNRNSLFTGMGQTFIDAANESGVDAMFVLAQAAHETAWGTSKIARDKYNFFGWNANDSNPYNDAHTFKSVEDGIKRGAQNVAKNYVYSDKHQQTTLHKFIRDDYGWHNYATDKDYDNKVANIMADGLAYVGKGYGGEAAKNYESVGTSREKVLKDASGNNIDVSPIKEMIDSDREILKVTDTARETQHMINLLEKVPGTEGLVTRDKKVYDFLAAFNETNPINKKDEDTYANTDEFQNSVKKDVRAKYEQEMQYLRGFLSGDKDSEDYKAWENKSMSEKQTTFDLLSTIEKVVPEIVRELGLRGTNLLVENERDIFTEDEKDPLDRINEHGKYDPTAKNEKNADYRDYVRNGGKDQYEDSFNSYQIAQEGFRSSLDNAVTLKMDEFNKAARVFNDDYEGNLVNETEEERRERASGSLLNAKNNGQLNMWYSGMGWNYGKLEKNINAYTDRIQELVTSGEYSNAGDALLNDKDLIKLGNKIKKAFNSEEEGQNFLDEIGNTETVSARDKKHEQEGDGEEYRKRMILEQFGSKYLGIEKSDYISDIGQYNVKLNDNALEVLENKKKMILDYASGVGSEESHAWIGMDTSEKSATIELIKQLEYALGKDGEGSVTRKTDIVENFEENLYTDIEKEKMNHLREQKDGTLIYDASYNASEDGHKRTAKDYDEWRRQGEKVDKMGGIDSMLKELGIDADDDGETIASMKQKILQQMDQIIAENDKLAKEAVSTARDLESGKDKSLGEGFSDEDRRGLAAAIKSGDTGWLEEFKKKAQEAGQEFNEDVINKYIELAKAVGGVDITGLAELIDVLDDVGNRAKDVGNTANLLKNTMGEGYEKNMDNNIIKAVEEAFDGDTDLGKKVRNGKLNADDLIDLLSNGGVGKDFVLSAESIEALSVAMAGAMDESLSAVMKSNEGLAEFMRSDLYELVSKEANKNQQTIVVGSGEDAKELSFDEATRTVAELNDKIAEATRNQSGNLDELKQERESLIQDVTNAFQQTVDGIGDINTELDGKLDKAAGDAKTTVETFEKTMKNYDAAIGGAIDTMQNRIDKLDGNLSFFEKLGSQGILGALLQ